MKNIIALSIGLVFIAIITITPPAWSKENYSYDFGVVPQFEQRKLFRIWRPILDELERRTGINFNLIGSSKIPDFEKKHMEGAFDFAYMNPYHCLTANKSQGYVPLVKDGSRMLRGILVVLKESPIKSVNELAGKRIAFPAPNALGASLILRSELDRLHKVAVIPHYVQTHSSVFLHVALGLTQAGGGAAATLHSQRPEVKEKLRILYETKPTHPHPISVHPRVPKAHQQKVLRALVQMAKTKNGAALLAKIPMNTLTQASMEDYLPMSSWGLGEYYESGD
jgi:phosphonate transport system substrate-binding protein